MDYKDYKKLKNGDKCVVVSTGTLGTVTQINRNTGVVRINTNMGAADLERWYNYIELGKV